MRVPTAWITAAAFDRLAHGDGAAWWTAALAGQARPRALGLTAHLTIRSTFIARSSPNVGGLVRGATLPDEIVVVTAHLDHLGVDASGAVYPGAVDNASGVAVLLELGRALAAGPPPARSILLLATTGEEEGLLGADYFVHHPTLRAGQRVVAAINLDGVNPRRAVHDVIVLGAEAGPLATAARAASRVTGLALSPADADDARYWIRSDQLPFVRAGIPAVWPFAGAADAGGDRAANDAADRAWVAAHYHQPRDRWEPAYSGAFMVPEAAFALALVRAIAAAP
jgi:Zn-dependent M28 family amino/carboxypeptidase